MSHDTDKLIRQLSLVAFLMAERRPLTARDVKANVEGYSEMSDEAFARRFYSDRAELTALGVPLMSQRDEFTGEELYTLRSENYFLDELDLDDDELAALQTALYPLEGKFAYAEPLRLALQNLALGRPGFRHAPTATAERVRVTAPDYSPELAARLSKLEIGDLEAADDQVQLLVAGPRARDRAPAQSVRAAPRRGRLVRRRPRSRPRRDPHVPGLADPQRHPLRDAARARLPAAGRLRRRGPPRPAAVADRRAGRPSRGSRCRSDTAWWVERTLSDAGTLDGRRLRDASTRSSEPLAGWILRQNGRAVPLDPPELRDEVADALRSSARRHMAARRPSHARERRAERRRRAGASPAGPVAPERFGVLQALLAHLLAACGDERGTRSRRRRARRAVLDPARGAPGAPLAPQPRQLRRRLLHGLRRGRRGDGTASASTRSSTATCSAGRRS